MTEPCPYCGGASWCPGPEICGAELDEPPRTHPYGVVIPDKEQP